MKTILFGGSGFLGYHMLKKNPDIISVGRTQPESDITNRHIHVSLDDLSVLDSIDFDTVIFLVGNSNHHVLNESNLLALEYNVIPLKKILHYLSKRKIKKLIHYTSILLYGSHVGREPVSEGHQLYPLENEYVFSKFLAEKVAEFYHEKVPIITARLTNIYGPIKLQRPDLVPRLMQDAIKKDNPVVWSLEPQRDFIYVDDAVDFTMQLLASTYLGPINLCSGTTSSVGQVVSIIERLTGKKITSLNKPVTGPMKFQADVSLLHKLTTHRPAFDLEAGLTKTYQTMKEYQ